MVPFLTFLHTRTQKLTNTPTFQSQDGTISNFLISTNSKTDEILNLPRQYGTSSNFHIHRNSKIEQQHYQPFATWSLSTSHTHTQTHAHTIILSRKAMSKYPMYAYFNSQGVASSDFHTHTNPKDMETYNLKISRWRICSIYQ